MKIDINSNTTVGDVQYLFTQIYPQLKIEFYRLGVRVSKNYPKKALLPLHFILEVSPVNTRKAEMNVDGGITVAELEKQFAEIGLNIILSRKSGAVWIETALTDHWTLDQQNTEAEEVNSYSRTKKSSV